MKQKQRENLLINLNFGKSRMISVPNEKGVLDCQSLFSHGL